LFVFTFPDLAFRGVAQVGGQGRGVGAAWSRGTEGPAVDLLNVVEGRGVSQGPAALLQSEEKKWAAVHVDSGAGVARFRATAARFRQGGVKPDPEQGRGGGAGQ